jgi:hypothetical protein
MISHSRLEPGRPSPRHAFLSFLRSGGRTSGVEGTHQVLSDAGEISVSVFRFLLGIQTGELPHRLNMRPFGAWHLVFPGSGGRP